MDKYIHNSKNVEYTWLTVSECYGEISQNIHSKDETSLKENITKLISILLKISHENRIDMKDAWENWNIKAISKHYD
jgi:NTP pyrophosphatase (non-canonical NTP hydrolase)